MIAGAPRPIMFPVSWRAVTCPLSPLSSSVHSSLVSSARFPFLPFASSASAAASARTGVAQPCSPSSCAVHLLQSFPSLAVPDSILRPKANASIDHHHAPALPLVYTRHYPSFAGNCPLTTGLASTKLQGPRPPRTFLSIPSPPLFFRQFPFCVGTEETICTQSFLPCFCCLSVQHLFAVPPFCLANPVTPRQPRIPSTKTVCVPCA